MRVLKAGESQEPIEVRYEGACRVCGCVLEVCESDGPPAPPSIGRRNSAVFGGQRFWARSVSCPTQNCDCSITCYPLRVKEGFDAIADELTEAAGQLKTGWFRGSYWRGKCHGLLLAMRILSAPSRARQHELAVLIDSLPVEEQE